MAQPYITPAGRISFRNAEHIVEKSTPKRAFFMEQATGIEPA